MVREQLAQVLPVEALAVRQARVWLLQLPLALELVVAQRVVEPQVVVPVRRQSVLALQASRPVQLPMAPFQKWRYQWALLDQASPRSW